MCGTAAREASHMPRRLTAIMRSHSSISISSKGERDIGTVAKIAALFTRMSIRPNASTARLAIASALARSATSVRTAIASKPWRFKSAATASAAIASISATTTFAPSVANPSAYALPMPCPPPVMIATLPAKRPAMLRSSLRGLNASACGPYSAAQSRPRSRATRLRAGECARAPRRGRRCDGARR